MFGVCVSVRVKMNAIYLEKISSRSRAASHFRRPRRPVEIPTGPRRRVPYRAPAAGECCLYLTVAYWTGHAYCIATFIRRCWAPGPITP